MVRADENTLDGKEKGGGGGRGEGAAAAGGDAFAAAAALRSRQVAGRVAARRGDRGRAGRARGGRARDRQGTQRHDEAVGGAETRVARQVGGEQADPLFRHLAGRCVQTHSPRRAPSVARSLSRSAYTLCPPRGYSARTRATSSFRRARARLVLFGPASSRDDTMCFDRVSRGDTNFTSNKVTDLSEGDARHRRRRPTSLPVHASIVSTRALTSSPRLLSRSPLSQANSSPSATRIASVFSR